MDLSTTNEAGAVYDTYLNSFRNQDGTVNWLPVCADTHGFVVNKGLAIYAICTLLDFIRQALFAVTVDRRRGHWFELLWDRIFQIEAQSAESPAGRFNQYPMSSH